MGVCGDPWRQASRPAGSRVSVLPPDPEVPFPLACWLLPVPGWGWMAGRLSWVSQPLCHLPVAGFALPLTGCLLLGCPSPSPLAVAQARHSLPFLCSVSKCLLQDGAELSVCPWWARATWPCWFRVLLPRGSVLTVPMVLASSPLWAVQPHCTVPTAACPLSLQVLRARGSLPRQESRHS